MTAVRASDLPVGKHIHQDGRTYVKLSDDVWRTSDSHDWIPDTEIDEILFAQAAARGEASAADLPVGSVVATATRVWIKGEQKGVDRFVWKGSGGGYSTGWDVDEVLADGTGHVLRVGDGSDKEGVR